MRLERCNRAASCVCAAMVRSGNSLYIVDSCNRRHPLYLHHRQRLPARDKMYDCDGGRQNLLAEHSGNTYKVMYKAMSVLPQFVYDIMFM